MAPEYLEGMFGKNFYVQQIVVDGLTTESSSVALVVPDFEYLRSHQPQFAELKEDKDIAESVEVKKFLLKELKGMKEKYKFKGYEIPCNIHLLPAQMTPFNGMMTPTFKLQRGAVRKKFKDVIEDLYKNK